MKNTTSPVLLRAAALASLLIVTGCSDPEVLAKVGDTPIRKADVERIVGEARREGDSAPAQVLETLITRELLAEAARDADLDADPKLRAQLASMEREVLAQALVERELAPLMTEAALRKRYEDQKESLQQRQVHVRHVMVRMPENPTADQRRVAQQRINFAYARLVGGEEFEEVVKQLQETPEHSVESADLGVLREGQVASSFFEAAAALDPREYSKPLETPYGFHVLQALAPAATVVPAIEEVRSRLAVEVRREAEAALIQRLRDDIRVKRYPERLEASQSPDSGAAAIAGEQ